MGHPCKSKRLLGGLWGAVIGDALGVPVEFSRREELKLDPVTDMIGHGMFDLPPGSWSDDSSLLICTVESLLEGFDPRAMARLFVRWFQESHWTPWGKTFDVGSGTSVAIRRLKAGMNPLQAGGAGELDNGNGSLMRVLPVAVFFGDAPAKVLLEKVHAVSSITHRHPRSLFACGVYCAAAARLLAGDSIPQAYAQAIVTARREYDEEPFRREFVHFERFLSGRLADLDEGAIRSSGYVIDTLEAALWSVLTTRSFEEAVLRAVNLGSDTDTTACVAGGLAGLHYGVGAIPKKWMDTIARKEDIEGLFEAFLQKVGQETHVSRSRQGAKQASVQGG